MKNFEIFFDVHMDTSVIVHNIKTKFEIFHFSAKFLNFLKGPPIEFFLNRFFSTNMHSETKFYIDLRCFLTFGLEPLPRELCRKTKIICSIFKCHYQQTNSCITTKYGYFLICFYLWLNLFKSGMTLSKICIAKYEKFKLRL